MDYGVLLSRAWNIIWEHKFLILLGVLVALTSSGQNIPNANYNLEGRDFDWEGQPPEMPEWPRFERWRLGLGPILMALGITGLVGIGVVGGLALWVISTLARGGLIDAVDAIEGGMSSDFGTAFAAGWQKGWTLLGISILPGIPTMILILGGLVLGGGLAALGTLGPDRSIAGPFLAGGAAIFGAILCIAIPLAIVLNAFRTFANRAAVIEDLSVFEAYRRGIQILFDNFGAAFLLLLIQIAIQIVLGVLLFVPSIITACCCFLWPLRLIVQGLLAAYFSTLWTLGWREWTGAQNASQ